jgi:hypothetical protein
VKIYLANREDLCKLNTVNQIIELETTPLLSEVKITKIWYITDELKKNFLKL